MPRVCTVCTHPQRPAIDAALVAGTPFRNIAERFAVSVGALDRHKRGHLPAQLTKATAAAEVAHADDLLGQVQELRQKALVLLAKAEAAGDYRTALAGVREARACIETLLEVEGELDRRPQVNILLAPQWLQVRALLLDALLPFPDARVAVSARLSAVEDGYAGA